MKLKELSQKYKRYFNQNTFNFIIKVLYNVDNIFLEENKEVEDKISLFLKDFLNGKPIEYLLNSAYFFHNYFYVNQNVLLPEDETEELVLEVIKEVKNKHLKGVDIGTGSGCIAITLKRELGDEIIASDISKEALDVFKINRGDLDIPMYQGDALKPLISNNIKVDYIVSNPPYISKDDQEVAKSVDDYYPHIALYADNNGLEVYESILKDALKVLNLPGYIFFEIGYNQGESLKSLANKYLTNCQIDVIKDINGHDRIVKIKVD